MLDYYIVYDVATGAICFRAAVQAGMAAQEDPGPGRALLILPRAALLGDDVDVDLLRAACWRAVRAARDRAEWWGCTTALGRVDTDADSQRKVSGAVQLAMIAQAAGQPFSVSWTMQDNSAVEHDAAAMIAMGVAVGRHVVACHATALAKREALEAGAEAADILVVDQQGGWPDAPAVLPA